MIVKMINKKILKPTLITIVFLIIGVLFINYRTPFFTPKSGGWSIGYKFLDSIPKKLDVENGNIFSLERMKKIIPNTILIADPFFIKERDSIYLFFEHQEKGENANIGLMKSHDGINFEYDRIVLDEKFHLSYPNVFKHKDEFFMLPETKRAHNILLYKAHDFPYDWRIYDTLIKNENLKDPSIFLSDSLNFLVASDDFYSLYLFKSDSLDGKWEKHKKRGLMLTGTEARPAGRIFINQNQNFILPVQNCSRGYGYGFSLYELNFNKNDSYDIRLFKKYFLKANKNIDEFAGGMHHLDFQRIDDKYYITYDGYSIIEDEFVFNWKFPLKMSYYDSKNYFYQLLY